MSRLERAKEVIKKYFKQARWGLFDTRNILGDFMKCIWHDSELDIDICNTYGYFEVFGLTEEEFEELEKYYTQLEKEYEEGSDEVEE